MSLCPALRPEHKTLLAERLQADQEYYRKKWLLQVHAEDSSAKLDRKEAFWVVGFLGPVHGV